MTQNASGTQLDVWFDFSKSDPYGSSIQCPIGLTTGCVKTSDGSPATWSRRYRLLPGVLHAYTASIIGYIAPAATTTPEPATLTLLCAGLAALGAAVTDGPPT